MSQKSYDGRASLYLIPTPIGNLQDLTLRAIDTIKMVDFLFCEDTRVTDQLLHQLHIKKKLIGCHDHNEDQVKESVLSFLEEGKNIGLVTDRGTPIISDPGYKVVCAVIEQGYNVIGLPGPTALIPALITSGLRPSPFLFYGFLNAKSTRREKELDQLRRFPYTMIFYEAPHRILDTLTSIQKVLGNRRVSVHREISKMYEEIYRGTVEELIKETSSMRGEIVLIVEGDTTQEDYQELTILEHVQLYLEDGLTEKEAIKKVALERNLAKSIVYKEYHTGK